MNHLNIGMDLFINRNYISYITRSLTQSLDRCKRKYQARLKRMEQQLKEMTLKQEFVSVDNSSVPETTV